MTAGRRTILRRRSCQCLISSTTGDRLAEATDTLRELVAAGLVTNDTAEALRAVIQWKPLRPKLERPIGRRIRGARAFAGCPSGEYVAIETALRSAESGRPVRQLAGRWQSVPPMSSAGPM